MKLLLTSNGLSNEKLKKKFVDLLEKPSGDVRVLVMRTTSKDEKSDDYFQEIKLELGLVGVKEENIIFVNLKENISAEQYKDLKFDVLWSCGGNTFVILDRMRKTSFDKFIKKFIKNNGFYVGTSAGSILIGPSIEIVEMGEGDENYIQLTNLKGLSIVDFEIYPHYITALEREVEEIKRKIKYRVVELEDGQALLIDGDRQEILK